MIGRAIKSKHNLWRSTLAAMIRENVHNFGLGAPSIYVKYHRRSAVALVTILEDPSERHQSVTMYLLTHQVAQLKALATTFLSTREGTLLPIKQQLNLHMRARQLACIHASKLHLALKANSNNGGRASTFTTNGNPALTMLLTKGIQTNKKEPQLYKHIANTTATSYSYYLPL
jgi:hypothetical protein